VAAIPQDEIDRLKREVSIQRLAEAHGIEIKAHGKDLLGLCPFHNDREPSLVITPAKNLWHCLGACQAGGTCIDWVMRAERLAFRDAVKWLQRFESPLVESSSPTTTRAPQEYTPADQALFLEVVAFYHEALKKSPDVLDYLKSRGIENQEAIERFKLGYSNRMLGKRFWRSNPRSASASWNSDCSARPDTRP
jgi:DNA primase